MASLTLLRGHGLHRKLRRRKLAGAQSRSPSSLGSPHKPLSGPRPQRKRSRSDQDRVGRGKSRRLLAAAAAAGAAASSPRRLRQAGPGVGARFAAGAAAAAAAEGTAFSPTASDAQEQVCNTAPAVPAAVPVSQTASTDHAAVPSAVGATDAAPAAAPVAQTASTAHAAVPGAVDATDEELAANFEAAVLRLIDHSIVDERLTAFHASRPPPVNMPAYLDRIRTFFECSGACYVLGLVYLRRLLDRHPDIKFSPLSCHRLVSTSLAVAAKFYDDAFQSNTYYAKIAGVKVAEFNGLESRFIKLLDWNLTVSPEEYYKCLELVGDAKILHA